MNAVHDHSEEAQAGYLGQMPGVSFGGTAEDMVSEPIATGLIKELPVGILWAPEEQRDIIARHPGLDAYDFNWEYLGTLTALLVEHDGQEKYVLVDGAQRASHIYNLYGPEARARVHVVLGKQYSDALRFFLALNKGRAQVKPFYYWRAKARAKADYAGIKSLNKLFTNAGFQIGQRTEKNTFTGVDALLNFCGMRLKEFDHEDEKATLGKSDKAAVEKALDLIKLAWRDDHVDAKQRLNAGIVVGLALVLRDTLTVKGKHPDERKLTEFLIGNNPSGLVGGGNIAAAVYKKDGRAKEITGTTRGGGDAAYGVARYILACLNGDRFSLQGSQYVLKPGAKAASNKFHLIGDAALNEPAQDEEE